MDDLKPAQVPPTKRLSSKTQVTVLLLVAVLVVAGFIAGPTALHVLFGTPPIERTQETAAQAGDGRSFKPTDRQWATLKLQRVDDRVFQDVTTTDGKIAIDDDLVTSVFSPYSGHVTKLIAKPGDEVARGDPLFAIQATELAQGQNDLISAVATLRTAKAQLTLAQTNEKRQHALYQAQGAALKDWQQSQVDLANAEGNLSTAAIALSAVRSRLRIYGKSDSDISTLEATPDILKINADTFVRAPIAGTITQRQIGLGQNIVGASASSGASSPVYQIGDLSKVWLVANAREEDAPLLHKGDRAEVSVLAFPGRSFNARLTYVAPSIDSITHRLPVRAEVENPKRELKPEMLAGFRIITSEDATAPAVPESALVFEGSSAHVWTADPATKTLAIQPVKVGRLMGGMAEIMEGLTAGETVVVAGAVFIDRAAAGD
ncbi:efflux RND transporter periplasmic adaptor subunit [Rhodopila sp.]|uniref:efflux RND transporter periplasmic adaptor subunit n=1 Tax=Rhodopila sp. TaxID=2480087 RepID=UPI003D13BA77